MLNGWLYIAWSDGTFDRRTFNGSSYGSPVAVNTSSELTALTDWVTDIKTVTGMFYDSGRIYFTKSGSSSAVLPALHAGERRRRAPSGSRPAAT